MGIEKKVYSFRLDEDLAAKIRKYSELENRSFSNMVITILKKYIEEREQQQQ